MEASPADSRPDSTVDGGDDSSPEGSATGSATTGASCSPGGPGMTNCGVVGDAATPESCCTSLEVTGGTYYRTYDPVVDEDGSTFAMLAADGGPTGEADPATVSPFRLDKYLVTVGRFRQYVNYLTGTTGSPPGNGSGKHTHLNGGLGLGPHPSRA